MDVYSTIKILSLLWFHYYMLNWRGDTHTVKQLIYVLLWQYSVFRNVKSYYVLVISIHQKLVIVNVLVAIRLNDLFLYCLPWISKRVSYLAEINESYDVLCDTENCLQLLRCFYLWSGVYVFKVYGEETSSDKIRLVTCDTSDIRARYYEFKKKKKGVALFGI